VIFGSKSVTLDATVAAGIGGRFQTLAEADSGWELPAGGSESAAVLQTQPAYAGPLPTLSVMAGVEPSARPASTWARSRSPRR